MVHEALQEELNDLEHVHFRLVPHALDGRAFSPLANQ